MTDFVGVTEYDSVYPTALLRITFQKAHWWHTAAQFAEASQDVYENLSPTASLYPAQPFPLAGEKTTWTIDARNQKDRTMGQIARDIAATCDVIGTDFVEVASIAVLSVDQVRKSTGLAGAAERNAASAGATATAASNPGAAIGAGIDKIPEATKNLFDELKTILFIVVVIAVLALLLMRKS